MFFFGVVLMKSLFVIIGFASFLFGSEYSVVVSKKTGVSEISQQQLRDLFLQKRRFVGDQPIVPVNILGHDDVRSTFESKLLQMDRNQLNSYWVKQHFKGISPPLTQPSFESVKSFIENVDGAIGYLPSAMVDSKMRVLYEF